MAKKSAKTGSAKRYGARYGRTNREKVGIIEAELRKDHKCPYCSAPRVKRIAVGIWNCTKCGKKFTGKAYTVSQKRKTIEIEEAPIKETVETEEAPAVEEEIEKGVKYSESPIATEDDTFMQEEIENDDKL